MWLVMRVLILLFIIHFHAASLSIRIHSCHLVDQIHDV